MVKTKKIERHYSEEMDLMVESLIQVKKHFYFILNGYFITILTNLEGYIVFNFYGETFE